MEGPGKPTGTHHLLAYNDVNLLGDNIHAIKKYTETLIDDSKEVGLEINVEKTKYMLLSHHQNVGQSPDTEIASGSFGNVSQLQLWLWLWLRLQLQLLQLQPQPQPQLHLQLLQLLQFHLQLLQLQLPLHFIFYSLSLIYVAVYDTKEIMTEPSHL
jgi:hypothetical protein